MEDDISYMTVSELEICRRTLMKACFPTDYSPTRERLMRDILMLKTVSNSKVGEEAVFAARAKPLPIVNKVVDFGETSMTVPTPPPRRYNKPGIVANAEKKAAVVREKKVSIRKQRRDTLLIAADEEDMTIRVPAVPKTKLGDAVAAVTTKVKVPKAVMESLEDPIAPKPRAPRKPKAEVESKEETETAIPPPLPTDSNPFSRYVRLT